jgi:glycosyltransferase involved in cell wall biosynthesis
MKILMLLSKSYINDSRVIAEAQALHDQGNEITVIIWDREKKYKHEEIIDGIRVVSIRNSSLMNIIPKDLLRNPFWWRKAYSKALRLFRDGFNFDVVHCHDLDTLLSGVWLKKKIGCKLVYDAHEIFGYMVETRVSKCTLDVIFKMEQHLLKSVDNVITINDFLKEYFEKLTDNPVTVVMNCKDLISKNYKTPKNNVFTALYVGTLNRGRLFPQLVDALAEISDIKIVIAGRKDVIEVYNEVERASLKYENVEFLGTIPSDQVIPLTCKSNVVVCPLDPFAKNPKIATANKQFEAMVCGRPIICVKGTYPGKMTEELNCGLVTDYDPHAIKEAVIQLKNNTDLCEELGKNALIAAITTYNWEKQKKKLLDVYAHLI